MGYKKEDLAKAFELLKNYCKIGGRCSGCPFKTDVGCYINNTSIENWVLPKSLQKKRYRPFKGAEEFDKYRNKLIIDTTNNTRFMWLAYDDRGISFINYKEIKLEPWDIVLERFTFEDGTPCGVEVKE